MSAERKTEAMERLLIEITLLLLRRYTDEFERDIFNRLLSEMEHSENDIPKDLMERLARDAQELE